MDAQPRGVLYLQPFFGRQITKRLGRKARLHKTVSASKAIFLSNTAQKRYGRRQPYHSVFSCLAIKIFTFEVLRSFAPEIFSSNKQSPREILCVFQWVIAQLGGKRLGAKPNNVL